MTLKCNGIRQNIFHSGQWIIFNCSGSDGKHSSVICLLISAKNETTMMTHGGILTDDLDCSSYFYYKQLYILFSGVCCFELHDKNLPYAWRGLRFITIRNSNNFLILSFCSLSEYLIFECLISWISEMSYHYLHSDLSPHLSCCYHSISVAVPCDLLQVFANPGILQ